MTIRRRLLVWVVLAFTGVIIVSGAAVELLLRSQLIDDIDARLMTRREVVEQLTLAGADNLTDPAPQEDRALLVVGGDGSVQLSIPSGSEGDLDPLPDLTGALEERSNAPFTVGAEEGSLEYRAVRIDSPGDEGFVLLAIPTDDVESTVRTAQEILLGVGVASVVVVGIAVWWAIRHGLKPVNDMIETAGRIGGGDLSQRVPVIDSDNEVSHLGLALNAMLGQIEEAVQIKTDSEERLRRFVSDASHELRTPLTSIRGYAELHRRGATSPEQIATGFSRIESESARMGDLVEDLLTLTRLDQGRPLEFRPVELGTIVADSVDDAGIVEPKRPFHFEPHQGEVIVQGDDRRLRQIVGNLLGNVRDHTEPTVPVYVGLSIGDQTAIVTVRDEGPGMSEQDASHAFDRFYRAEHLSSGGTGLGLSIVKSIVEAHGGSIELDTALEMGTTITVSLPLASQAPNSD